MNPTFGEIMNKLNHLFRSLGLNASLLAAGTACAADLTLTRYGSKHIKFVGLQSSLDF